jgi:NADH oxidase (H2O2-forming)
MVTKMKNVYACGDCIESKDIVTGEAGLSLLWPNARRQGWVSGCNCAGEQKKFPGSFDATNLEIAGTYALSAGKIAASLSGHGYEVIEKRCGPSYYRLVMVDNRLLGIQLIDRIEHGGLLFSKMLRKDDITGLARTVFDDKLLAARPWNYWLGPYMASGERRKI